MLVDNGTVPPARRPARGAALAALSLSVVVVGLDTTVLNVALPSIATALRADTSDLQWVVDAYLLAVVAVMLPAGRLGDRFGHRRVLLAGLLVFGVGSVASALSTSIASLVAARAVQGAGAAVLVPLALALVTTTVPAQGRASAMGVLTAAVALGLPLGPLVGGALLARWSWASVFWINVPVVAAATVAVFLAVKGEPGRREVRIDAVGVVMSTAGLLCLVDTVIEAPGAGWTSPRTAVGALLALVALTAFAVHQRRSRHPVADTRLFTDPRFTGGVLAVAGASAVLLAVLFVVPLYLQGVRGDSAPAAGLRLLPLMLGLLVAGAVSSRLQQARGSRAVVTGALVVLAVSCAGLAATGPGTPTLVLEGLLGVVGAGVGAAVSPAMDAATGVVPLESAASGAALVNAVRQVSGALAVAVLGSLLASAYASRLAPAVSSLPSAARAEASGSLDGARVVIRGLAEPDQRRALQHAAASAFSAGVGVMALTCCGIALVCALASWALLGGRAASAAGAG